MGLEDLIVRLRIKEDNQILENKSRNPMESKPNVVEERHKTNMSKKRKIIHANVAEVENLFNDINEMNLFAVVYEANLLGNPRSWWLATGATRHICSHKNMFTFYHLPNHDEEHIFMENSFTSIVEGKGKVMLKMTSVKEVTLTNALHAPEICKNFVSISLLSKNGFMLVFESHKFILSKGGMYVSKCLSEGLF